MCYEHPLTGAVIPARARTSNLSEDLEPGPGWLYLWRSMGEGVVPGIENDFPMAPNRVQGLATPRGVPPQLEL